MKQLEPMPISLDEFEARIKKAKKVQAKHDPKASLDEQMAQILEFFLALGGEPSRGHSEAVLRTDAIGAEVDSEAPSTLCRGSTHEGGGATKP